MPKTGKILEIGSYRVELFREETKIEYEKLPPYEGTEDSVLLFHHLMRSAPSEAKGFLEDLGIDLRKLCIARPLTLPDENGEILYLAHAPLCARVLAGGDTEPRQSEEIAGLSVIFVGEAKCFLPSLPAFPEGAELRFVIPLLFDASFFENKK